MTQYSKKGPIYLFLCAIFWGTTFSAQSSAMRYIGPYTFVFSRSIITSVILFAIYPLLCRMFKSDTHPQAVPAKRYIWIGGLCGVFLALGSCLQQVGLTMTTTAKSGFITALYILFVPMLGLFMHQKTSKSLWIGVGVSIIGLYLLCMQGQLAPNLGDLFTLFCAIAFALHIIVVDKLGNELDSILLSASQFASCAICTGLMALLTETPTMDGIVKSLFFILYAAIVSGSLGYTLQIAGQRYTHPTIASLIMCLESVFAAIGGWILLGQSLSAKEILGCVFMLAASFIALLGSDQKQA